VIDLKQFMKTKVIWLTFYHVISSSLLEASIWHFTFWFHLFLCLRCSDFYVQASRLVLSSLYKTIILITSVLVSVQIALYSALLNFIFFSFQYFFPF